MMTLNYLNSVLFGKKWMDCKSIVLAQNHNQSVCDSSIDSDCKEVILPSGGHMVHLTPAVFSSAAETVAAR